MRITLFALTMTVLLSGPANRHAEAAWFECGTVAPFHIQSDYVLRNPDAVLQLVKQLKEDFEKTLQLKPSQRTIEVRLFLKKRDYKSHVGKRIPHGERHPALFVKGPDVSWIYIYAQPDFFKNLRHECAHALLHNSLYVLPLWLDEGLAQYLELPTQRAANEHAHLAIIRRSVARGGRPNLPKLEKKSKHDRFSNSDYQESWAWVHFLLHGPQESRKTLRNYLKKIESREFAGRMSEWMNTSTFDFDRQFVAHFHPKRSR
jgi:hypothetical protein